MTQNMSRLVPDFAAIIEQAARSTGVAPHNLGANSLAAKVPELCPDCGGSGTHRVEAQWRDLGGSGIAQSVVYAACHHPDAPTIADVLAAGVQAMTEQGV